jgi:hypothetical protein
VLIGAARAHTPYIVSREIVGDERRGHGRPARERRVIRPADVAPPETLELSATRIAAAVNAGDLDPASLIRACMEEIEGRYDLSAVLARGYAAAIKRARRGVHGPLAGVPMLVSDTLDTASLMMV